MVVEDGFGGSVEAIIRKNSQFIWPGKVQISQSGNFKNYGCGNHV